MKDDYKKLVEFWNKCYSLDDNEKEKITDNPNDCYKTLAPSQKQYEVLKMFSGKENVLDYGCGGGWASVIMAKEGAKSVTSVDVANASYNLTLLNAKAYKVEHIIHPFSIDEKWLEKQEDEKYDGFFSSNVIDVIPLEMAKDIVKNSARVLSKGAKAVFSLNYYMDPKEMEKRGIQMDGHYVYIDGILRLSSLSDDEWSDIFKEYYEIDNLSYYSWPNEKKETRRLFVLKKK